MGWRDDKAREIREEAVRAEREHIARSHSSAMRKGERAVLTDECAAWADESGSLAAVPEFSGESPSPTLASPRASTALADVVRRGTAYLGNALAETAWPTRCCVCDLPGTVLCADCRARLPWLDYWRACPVCGAPYGICQCSECNQQTLRSLGRERYPFDSCTSPVLLSEQSRRIVVTYKDRGERRLAAEMAALMAQALPPSWSSDARPSRAGNPPAALARTRVLTPPQAVFPIPATKAARARRGFDHGEELARELAGQLGLPCWNPFAAPRARDQRALDRRERAQNTAARFRLEQPANARTETRRRELARPLPACVLLVDDVFTTGSTLSAAADALKEAGVACVHAVTFARTFAGTADRQP